MADEHITARMGLDRSSFDRGLAGATGGIGGMGAAAGRANRALMAMQSSLRLLGVAGSTAILGMAVRGMSRMATSTREARDEINRLTAAGESASISAKMMADAARLDDETLARVDQLRDSWGKFRDEATVGITKGVSKFAEALAVVGESLVDFATGENLFKAIDENIERRAHNIQQIAQETENERRQGAIRVEVARLNIRLQEIQARAAMKRMSDEEKLAHHLERQADIVSRMHEGQVDAAEFARMEVELAGAVADIEDSRVAIAKRLAAEREKEAQSSERAAAQSERELAALTKSAAAAAGRQADRSSVSLGELAQAAVFTRQGAMQRAGAQRVMQLEAFAKQARIEGRGDLADQAIAEGDRIRSSLGALSASERDPGAELHEINQSIAALLDAAKTDGLKIQPINGE